MGVRTFRMNPSSDDPAGLLSAECQWTEPWGSSEDGSPCDKCDGSGEVCHECWSCLLTGARPTCPACSGEVMWVDRCPVCRGTTRVDGKPRRGVSVFPTLEGLYHYMLVKEADLDDCTIVELEGERAADVDFDADQGAMLVVPTSVLRCLGADRQLAADVRARTSEIAQRSPAQP